MKSFRPLMGMILGWEKVIYWDTEFSPPYGDGTEIVVTANYREWFSPPYGDGT